MYLYFPTYVEKETGLVMAQLSFLNSHEAKFSFLFLSLLKPAWPPEWTKKLYSVSASQKELCPGKIQIVQLLPSGQNQKTPQGKKAPVGNLISFIPGWFISSVKPIKTHICMFIFTHFSCSQKERQCTTNYSITPGSKSYTYYLKQMK